MSPVFVNHSVFGAKSAENGELRKMRFLVRRQKCSLGLQIRSFSAENLLQVFAVLRNPFSPRKTCEFQPAELVTAEVTGL